MGFALYSSPVSEYLDPALLPSPDVMLSVVVPMFNEDLVVDQFVARLRPVLDGLSCGYEVVCVDDGSTDGTARRLLAHLEQWPQLRLVRLVRNAGHQAALTAGYDTARGHYVATIDADLQDPPEKIADMLLVAVEEGVDVVYGVRSDRSSDSAFKRGTARMYYRVMRRVAGEQIPADAGDFRLISRRVVSALQELPAHGRVYRLAVPWLGFPSAQVTFVRDERAAGVTKYPLRKMLALSFDSLASFSAAPLRLATWAGIIGGLVSLLATAWSIYGWWLGITVPGWASLLATAGFIGAIQLICLGLLGEYVARIFVAMQNRPTYLIGYDSARDQSRSRS